MGGWTIPDLVVNGERVDLVDCLGDSLCCLCMFLWILQQSNWCLVRLEDQVSCTPVRKL